jgi:hypothetical protein
VDRRIHPDLNSLVESYSAAEESEVPHGLKPMPSPRSRRHSVDGSSTWRTQLRLTSRLAPPIVVQDSVQEEEPSSSVQRLPTAEWSTFGRTKDHTSPRISDFGNSSARNSPVRRPSSKLSKGTSNSGSLRSNTTSPRSPVTSRPSTGRSGPSLAPPTSSSSEATHSSPQTRTSEIPSHHEDNRHSSESPNTHSSHSKRTPTRRRSIPSHSTPSPHSAANISHKTSRDLAFESPKTFGHPTPELRPGSGQSFGFVWGEEAPPMPTLDHPALAVSLGSRAQTLAVRHGGSNQNLKEPAADPMRDRESERRPSKVSQTSHFSTLPFRFGRSRPSRSHSMPKVQQIFQDTKESQGSSARSPVTPRARRRAKSGSITKHERRRSADWTSSQALAGVNANGEFSWPAQVSREMLKMSLGTHVSEGDISKNNAGVSGNGFGSGSSERGKSVPGKWHVLATLSAISFLHLQILSSSSRLINRVCIARTPAAVLFTRSVCFFQSVALVHTVSTRRH